MSGIAVWPSGHRLPSWCYDPFVIRASIFMLAPAKLCGMFMRARRDALRSGLEGFCRVRWNGCRVDRGHAAPRWRAGTAGRPNFDGRRKNPA
jgi:hypothetical protein